MHPLLLVLPLLPLAAFSDSGGGDGCNRRCNGVVVPYPFGFSPDCPILLACNAPTSTVLLPHSTTSAPPCPITSFNSTTSTFLVSVAPSCNRSVVDAKASLNGAGFGVSSHTGLYLRGGCQHAPAATNCTVPGSVMSGLLRTAQCGANDSSWTCVTSTPNSAAAARGQGQFMDWAMVDAAGCEGALTAALYTYAPTGALSMELGVAELGWWLNGTCASANASANGQQCAQNATCHDVVAPSGAPGHRCSCLDGMSGDGFAAGHGCHYGAPASSLSHGELSTTAFVDIFFGAFFLATICCFCLCAAFYPSTPVQAAGLSRGEPLEDDLEQEKTRPRRYSYDELAAATENFSDNQILGSGGFGSVYRGFLADSNRDVAVKRISDTSEQGWEVYVSEVRMISRLRHRNLLPPIGWCHGGNGGDELLLVYELMPKGSLDTHLHGGPENEPLAWPVRYRAALGVGAALLYLHEEVEQRVVHRDVKPSNVMLDASFTAKLGDFGLARLIDDGRRSRTTGFAGTLGYVNQECMLAGKASVEFDVYSFGVLLLEVACGKKPGVRAQGDYVISLVNWVWEFYGREAILDAADERLHGEFDARQMKTVMVVGLWCAHPDRSLRPSIRQAVKVLRFDALLPVLPERMPVPTYYGHPADLSGSTSSSAEYATVTAGGTAIGIEHSSTTESSR